MKILSLWQPWATLIAAGAKHIETRNWATHYRGELAIHAAKKWDGELQFTCLTEPFRTALREAGYPHANCYGLPFGFIVAMATLIDCCSTVDMIPDPAYPCAFRKYPTLDTPNERAFGNYEPGQWAWVFGKIMPLRQPISYKGGQGLRNLDPEVERRVRELAMPCLHWKREPDGSGYRCAEPGCPQFTPF